MTEVVLDASVVLKWFVRREEPGRTEARALRGAYEAGGLVVVVPALLYLEVLNVAGRRWGWDADALLRLVAGLEDLGFELADPALASVAAWTARGLTAYDAAYVAIAEERGIHVVSDDRVVLDVAGPLARPLASVR